MKRFLLILLLTATISISNQQEALALESQQVSSSHIKLKILSKHENYKFGEKLLIAVEAIPDPDWHFYWLNPGDSGSSPKFDWSASLNAKISDPMFPIPTRISSSPLANFGYAKDTLILFEVEALDQQTNKIELRLDSEFLVCKEECIPANAFIELSIQKGEPTVLSKDILNKFEQTTKELPFKYPSIQTQALQTDTDLIIKGRFPESVQEINLEFFPYQRSIINNAADQILSIDGSNFSLVIPKKEPGKIIQQIEGILVSQSGWVDNWTQAIELDLSPIRSSDSTQKINLSLLTAVFLAFLGGLILNLMPCVFPVLTIKLFSLLKKRHQSFKTRLITSVIFSSGVILSFLLLSGLIVIARESGQTLGWGFQLQNPSFVAGLIVLIFLMGLNFLGVFEFGSSIQNILHKAHPKTQKNQHIQSFFDGILVTALATPCTAPFMGSAMAYGLSAPYLHTAAVFSSLAIGVAFPFAAINLWTGLSKFMPKPGVWMEHLKKLMAFPLFATTIWLIWVLGLQTSAQTISGLLAILLLLSFSFFLLGQFITPTSSTLRRVILTLIIFLSLAFTVTAISQLNSNSKTTQIVWQEFSENRLKELRQNGKIIYVDFTAAWCITCQVNKIVALSDPEVIEVFRKYDVVALKADWTNKSPEIARVIQSFGREGVPLNVIYPANSNQSEEILPQILTPKIVLEALDRVIHPR